MTHVGEDEEQRNRRAEERQRKHVHGRREEVGLARRLELKWRAPLREHRCETNEVPRTQSRQA